VRRSVAQTSLRRYFDATKSLQDGNSLTVAIRAHRIRHVFSAWDWPASFGHCPASLYAHGTVNVFTGCLQCITRYFNVGPS
jgi:hypothetical protein